MSQTKDTWSGMPWEEFIAIAMEQRFQMAYQKAVSAKMLVGEIEAIIIVQMD